MREDVGKSEFIAAMRLSGSRAPLADWAVRLDAD
jgi:hypothetical protein